MAWRSFVARTHRAADLAAKCSRTSPRVTRIAEEALTGIRVVKAFSREDFESERFTRPPKPRPNLSYSRVPHHGRRTSPLLQGLGALQIAITVGFGAWLITKGTLTAGDLLTFALWLNLLQLPVRTHRLRRSRSSRAASPPRSASSSCSTPSRRSRRSRTRSSSANVDGHVRFEDVGFGYDNAQRRACETSTSTRSPGKVIALLGPAGQRQVDRRQPHPALLRRHRRPHHDRRHRHARRDARLAAQAHRHRPAGRLPLHRHDPRQHRLRPPGRDAGR